MRFTGTVERIMDVDPAALAAWVQAIPFEEWPQQHRLADGLIRPAMMNDPAWRGFGFARRQVTATIMERIGAGQECSPMLSVVMPGHAIPAHADRQLAAWRCRVHVPLATNERAAFIVDGERFHLETGAAYLVNTEREHEVRNDGETPRIHYMFDVTAGG
jgi:hypothetical protein